MWRPMEIFLYSRWPVKRMRQLYMRLSNMEVRLSISDHFLFNGPGTSSSR